MLEEMLSSWQFWLAAAVVLLCVLPLIFFGAAAWMLRRTLNQISNPSVEHLHEAYRQIKAERPSEDHDDLVRAVIRRQAVRCGVVGALTGLGGFMTLPIALPADLLISLRLQASLVQFIAEAYGHSQPGKAELEIRRALIMSGSAGLSQSAVRVLMRFTLRVIGRSLAKFIPLMGALIGFAVNYAITQGSGLVAQEWYAGRIGLPGGTPSPALPQR